MQQKWMSFILKVKDNAKQKCCQAVKLMLNPKWWRLKRFSHLKITKHKYAAFG
jgi:hypothetical protein